LRFALAPKVWTRKKTNAAAIHENKLIQLDRLSDESLQFGSMFRLESVRLDPVHLAPGAKGAEGRLESTGRWEQLNGIVHCG